MHRNGEHSASDEVVIEAIRIGDIHIHEMAEEPCPYAVFFFRHADVFASSAGTLRSFTPHGDSLISCRLFFIQISLCSKLIR
ncbi:MAG: hypothetical protein CBB68_09155 [Rhodospirillaceae bacterium TMED8]|nr:hypothetical protein [Magnetovibrio sp.]OUT50524.1 MAG: hypothetical protein CBB68_09155 [Rhodospirillaceae bacterium TMED8]